MIRFLNTSHLDAVKEALDIIGQPYKLSVIGKELDIDLRRLSFCDAIILERISKSETEVTIESVRFWSYNEPDDWDTIVYVLPVSLAN